MQSDTPLTAREIAIREFNSFRGRILSVLESLGLPPSQEQAVRTQIKAVSFQSQAVIAELLDRIDSDAHFIYNSENLIEADKVAI